MTRPPPAPRRLDPDDPVSAVVHVRLPRTLLARYLAAARSQGLTISAWVRRALDREATRPAACGLCHVAAARGPQAATSEPGPARRPSGG